MARTLLAALTLFTVHVQTVRAEDDLAIPEEVTKVANETGVEPIKLFGATVTTGLEPREFMYQVGELRRPDPPKPLSYPDYIRQHSKYGERAVCVSRIETGSWTDFYNETPHYGEHAQGFFGWLPSTARTVDVTIMNLDSEIAGFDRMMDRGRGTEFYGILAKLC